MPAKKSKSTKKNTKTTNKSKTTKKNEKKKFDFWLIGAIVLIIASVIVLSIPKTDNPVTLDDVIIDSIDTEEAYIYAGLPFVKEEGIWTTEYERLGQTYIITREYGPREVEDIPVTYQLNNFSKALQRYRKYYITVNPEDDGQSYLAAVGASMILTLKQVYGYTAIPACTQNSTECKNKPIVNCDSGENYPVIQLTHGEPLNIEYSAKCLSVQGNGTDLIKAGDKIIYGWYGISE